MAPATPLSGSMLSEELDQNNILLEKLMVLGREQMKRRRQAMDEKRQTRAELELERKASTFKEEGLKLAEEKASAALREALDRSVSLEQDLARSMDELQKSRVIEAGLKQQLEEVSKAYQAKLLESETDLRAKQTAIDAQHSATSKGGDSKASSDQQTRIVELEKEIQKLKEVPNVGIEIEASQYREMVLQNEVHGLKSRVSQLEKELGTAEQALRIVQAQSVDCKLEGEQALTAAQQQIASLADAIEASKDSQKVLEQALADSYLENGRMAESVKAEVTYLEGEVVQKNSIIAALQHQLSTINNEKGAAAASLEAKVLQLESELKSSQQKLANADFEASLVGSRLKSLTAEVDTLEAQINVKERDLLSARASNTAYIERWRQALKDIHVQAEAHAAEKANLLAQHSEEMAALRAELKAAAPRRTLMETDANRTPSLADVFTPSTARRGRENCKAELMTPLGIRDLYG